MIMKKKRLIHPLTERVLRLGLTLLLPACISLFLLAARSREALSLLDAARLCRITEYLIVSLATLTAGAYLIERTLRAERS